MKLWNRSRQTLLAEDVRVANTFFSRLKGLLGTSELPQGQGLWIKPCDSIHMFGMQYAIDVIFVDEQGGVVKLVEDLRPGRLAGCSGASGAIELPSGWVKVAGVSIGDMLEIEKS